MRPQRKLATAFQQLVLCMAAKHWGCQQQCIITLEPLAPHTQAACQAHAAPLHTQYSLLLTHLRHAARSRRCPRYKPSPTPCLTLTRNLTIHVRGTAATIMHIMLPIHGSQVWELLRMCLCLAPLASLEAVRG